MKEKEIPVLFYPETEFVDFYWWKYHDNKYSWWSQLYYCKREDVDNYINEHFEKLSVNLSNSSLGEIASAQYYGKSKKFQNDLLINYSVNLDTNRYRFNLYWDTSVDESKIKEHIIAFREMQIKEDTKSVINMVIMEDGELTLRPFNINIPEIDIELNYGQDWKLKHDYLFNVLTADNKKKGIVLLHGEPGTGKSMYIRYLSSILHEYKDVIYMPNQLINSLTDPSFLPLMTDHPDSVLVIEDAEEALKSRKSGGFTVDKLLNIADGIISDFLGIQILCTFNSSVSMLDEALLRKGRLILKHEFKKLDIEASQKLINKLGFNYEVNKPMTLAEIYNIEDTFNEGAKADSRKPMGF